MDAALEIRSLKKRFGRNYALNGLDLRIPQGSIAAFVGANGAGKTTTFSLIGGFFRADRGEIQVQGLPLKRFRKLGGIIGLLPQDMSAFEDRTLERQLGLFAGLAGFTGRDARLEVERVLGLVGLQEKQGSVPSDLSHGMKVRFGVAQALVGNPPLVLLDEPTAGLDPQMVSSFREMIKNLKGGTTFVISSHDLAQLEQMCDWVCMIDKGRLVRQGELVNLLAGHSKVVFRLGSLGPDMEILSRQFPSFKFTMRAGNELLVDYGDSSAPLSEVNQSIFACLVSQKIEILGISSEKSLEEVFLEEARK